MRTDKRLVLLSVVPLTMYVHADGVSAGTGYECRNNSGTCTIQGGCANDTNQAQQWCADACAGGYVWGLTPGSTCTPWDPTKHSNTPLPVSDIDWCTSEPMPKGPKVNFTNTIGPHSTGEYHVGLKSGVKYKVWCHVSDKVHPYDHLMVGVNTSASIGDISYVERMTSPSKGSLTITNQHSDDERYVGLFIMPTPEYFIIPGNAVLVAE